MAALHELIAQVQDDNLRGQLQAEFKRLTDEKTFGLVFESSAEFFPRADLPVKKNSLVAKVKDIDKAFCVTEIDGDKIFCARDEKIFEFSRQDLICVSRLGEPIYPGLTKLDEVCNAPEESLWHMLIEAENYHALQLLKYPFAGKVDCIYIDPPYNTGASDWKYNNKFVDASDHYSHSKWLSMMERRLKLAKELLNPADSVLIVTIDEHEYLHLGCLLEELFGGATIQMVSSLTTRSGAARFNSFTRVNELIFFVMIGNYTIVPQEDADYSKKGESIHWRSFRRGNPTNIRTSRPSQFYPIYVDRKTKRIVKIGDPITPDVDRFSVEQLPNCDAVFPVRDDGTEMLWGVTPESCRKLLVKGYLRATKHTADKPQQYVILYLSTGTIKDIEDGKVALKGYSDDGGIIAENLVSRKMMPRTQWNFETHDARDYGTKILNAIIGGSKFAFPKSLYAVRDALKFFVANKPDALIVDFFAGSGTTLHAVNLLNAEDGGKRRCVLVTNNEGDIARSVTWPRTVCSVEGHDINGAPLKGNYLGTELAMSDGFKANAAFFALNCLDKNSVELGEQFNQTLPVLWLKAGGHGRCPTFDEKNLPPYKIFPENKFAVLFKESNFADFAKEIDAAQIETFFAVTGSDASLNDMAKQLRVKRSFRLYEDYLENFKLEEAES